MFTILNIKTKKEKLSRTSLRVPRPDTEPTKQGKAKQSKYLIIKVAKMGTLPFIFIKKTMFLHFWLPFGYPNK